MLDVYDMIEGYCNLLIERIHLIEHERFVHISHSILIGSFRYIDPIN